jgi:hypothetical protein
MMNCRQTSQLLSQSQDRPLFLMERLSLRLHLLLCGACQRFAQQLRFLRQAVVALDARAAQDGTIKLSDSARAQIKQALLTSDRDGFAAYHRK